MSKPYGVAIGLLMPVFILAAVPAVRAEDDRPLSPAQIALFESNHLKEIAHPVVLDYAFQHHGAPTGDFDDKVSAEIRTVHDDGRKDVWIDFLTGDHHVNFPPVMDFNGNPLLMFFLEHDVNEMGAVTGGSAQYFRTRIRQAFIDRAEMHPVQFTLAGAERSGTEIEVTPFHGDPNLARFAAFGDKTYHFILSDAVPGTIYQISTTMPTTSGAPGLFEESMTYAGEHEDKH